MEENIIIQHHHQKIHSFIITGCFFIFFSDASLGREYCASLKKNGIEKMQNEEGFSGGISGHTTIHELVVQMNAENKKTFKKNYGSSVSGISGGISGHVPAKQLIAQMYLSINCAKKENKK